MSRLLPSLPDISLGDPEPKVVDVEDDDADELFTALSSETARSVLVELHDEPATTSELADTIDTSLQNVQYHLGKLEDADLIHVADTVYSEKGREMNVYVPTSEPLVLFAGRSTTSDGIKTALKRLLGGYAIIALAALAVQSLLSVTVPGDDAGVDGYAVSTTDDAAEPEATPTPEADAETAEEGTTVVEVMFDGAAAERAEAAAEYAVALLEPCVVFFLGAAIVFTLAWAYWNYRLGRLTGQ